MNRSSCLNLFIFLASAVLAIILARTRETIGNYSRLLADRFMNLYFAGPQPSPAHPGQPQSGTEKPAT